MEEKKHKFIEFFECDDPNDCRLSYGRGLTFILSIFCFILGGYYVFAKIEATDVWAFTPMIVCAAVALLPYLITKWATVKDIVATIKGK
jgi:hypothetical protein